MHRGGCKLVIRSWSALDGLHVSLLCTLGLENSFSHLLGPTMKVVFSLNRLLLVVACNWYVSFARAIFQVGEIH